MPDEKPMLTKPQEALLLDFDNARYGELCVTGRYIRIADRLEKMGLVRYCLSAGGRWYKITDAGRAWFGA